MYDGSFSNDPLFLEIVVNYPNEHTSAPLVHFPPIIKMTPFLLRITYYDSLFHTISERVRGEFVNTRTYTNPKTREVNKSDAQTTKFATHDRTSFAVPGGGGGVLCTNEGMGYGSVTYLRTIFINWI